MNWTYTIEASFKDGDYEVRCVYAKRIIGKFGNFLQIDWKILTPQEFEGETLEDKFYIEADNETTKKIAKKGFKELCEQIQIKVGDTITEDDLFNKFIDRFAILTVQNKKNENSGTVYTNIIKRKIIEFPSSSKIKIKENQQAIFENSGNANLNDEVPF